MMKRFISGMLAFVLAFSGSLLVFGEAYAASQPIVLGHSDGFTVQQNADGSKTLTWDYEDGQVADPAQPENWQDQGESWSNSGEVAQTELRKTYEKNEALVTVRRETAAISFAPIQIEEPVVEPTFDVAESQQINERQTASNVLRIGPSAKRRPESIKGRQARDGGGMSDAVPAVYGELFDAHSDVRLTALVGGVKEDIVVHEYTGNHVYAYQVTVSGLSLQQQDQRVELVQDGKVVGEIEAPFMTDAAGAYSEDIAVTLTADGVLTYTPSDAWMVNAVYPVVIDPTTKYYDNVEDLASDWQVNTYVNSAQPNTVYFGTGGGVLRVSGTETAYSLPIFPRSSNVPIEQQLLVINNPNDILVDQVWLTFGTIGGSGAGRFSVRLVTEPWQNSQYFSYANKPAYTNKAYWMGNLPASGGSTLDLTEVFSEWFNMMDQKENCGIAIVSEDGASRAINGANVTPANQRPKYDMTYIENPDAPVITATPRGNAPNSGTGYVTLSWNAVSGAKRYYVGIFNGRDYEYFLLPLGQTTFSTQNMRIWPTQAEIAAGRYQLHHDGLGAELPVFPAFTYQNVPGGAYGNNGNYFFKVIPANTYGQAPDPSQARFAARAVTLPDTVPPNQPTAVSVIPASYTNAANITVSWNGVTDMTPTGTSNSLGTFNSAFGWGNIQYSIDGTTSWQNTGVNTASGSATFPTAGLADGRHAIYIRGVDASGNTGGFLGCYFYIDKTPPTAPNVEIAPDTWTKAATASLTWSGISDLNENLPLARVEYQYDTGAWINAGQDPADTTLRSGSTTLDISPLDGPVAVSVRGVDRAGNDGEVGVATAYVDHSVPTFSSAGVTPNFWTALNEVELAWEGAADAYSGLDALAYAINIESEVPLPVTTDGTETIDISHLADAQHELHFLLTDAVGNEHDEEIPVYVDRTNPDIALLSPVDGDWITGITEVWGSIDDLSIKEWRLTVICEDGVERPISSGASNRAPELIGRLNASVFADGERVQLKLFAEDYAGNSSTITGVYLIVDKSAKPIAGDVEITSPVTGQTLTTAKAGGAYDVQYSDPEAETYIYIDGKYVHDAKAGQAFDLYPILYQENSLHAVTAVSLDTSGGTHFSQGLGAYILLSDAFADDSLLAGHSGVSFSPTGDGALGAGSLTSIEATSVRPMLAFRLHAAATPASPTNIGRKTAVGRLSFRRNMPFSQRRSIPCKCAPNCRAARRSTAGKSRAWWSLTRCASSPNWRRRWRRCASSKAKCAARCPS